MPRARVGDIRIGRRAVLGGVAAWGMGAVLAGCANAPASPGPAGPPPPNGSGITKSDELRARFQQTAKDLLVPGAVLLVRSPEGEMSAVYGSRTIDGADPITLEDHARIGSVTKTLTGTVILQQAQEGKLDIDGPVAAHRPEIPNGGNITLAQLLSMRSGLYNYSESLELNQSLDQNPTRVWTPQQLLDLGLKYPPYFPPGTDFHYSNTNTVLLGLIAEQVDAQPLASIFQRRLFMPLAMHGTSFPDSAAIPDPHPRGYMYGTNVATMQSEALPQELVVAATAGELRPNDVTDASPSWTWAAGGAISTVTDLAVWARALGDGTLLNPTWQRRRLDSVQPINPGSPASPGYGLGIAKFGPMYGHTGELPGFQTFTAYDPDKKITLTTWANLNAAPDGRAPASTIAQELIGTLYS